MSNSNIIIKTYKYRLYPNRQQTKTLNFLLEQMRIVYNDSLNERRWAWDRSRRNITYCNQWARFRQARKDFPETIGFLNATSTQQMLRRLDKSFAAFFRRVKAGNTPGYPRFKPQSRFKSVEYRYGNGCKLNGNRLYIQRVGDVRVRLHRPIPDNAIIKHVVLKHSFGKWYACLMLRTPVPAPRPRTRREVGIDAGLLHLLTLSNGGAVENPRWLRTNLKKLRIAQRRAARREIGSNRWREACEQVAKIHEKIANQRRDLWHKTTRKLVDTYDLIAIENLNLEFMIHNGHLALSAHDASLGMFRRFLEYKAEEAGIKVIAVNPKNTSQICSGCGIIVRKDLNVRTHSCPSCGLILDRDINAARNILKLARMEPSGANVVGCDERSLKSSQDKRIITRSCIPFA